MSKSIIPWHVFRDAIETPNPHSLNLWLQRWRFMDAGVLLSDSNIPALELPNAISKLLREKSETDGCDTADEIMQGNSFN